MSVLETNQTPRQILGELSHLVGGQLLSAVAGLLLGKGIALYIPQAAFGLYSLGLATLTLGHAVLVSPVIQSLKTRQADYGWWRVLPFYGRILTIIYALIALLVMVWGIVTNNVFVSVLITVVFIGQGLYAIGSESVNLAGQFRSFSIVQGSYGLVNLLLFGVVVIIAKSASSEGLWVIAAVLNTLFSLLTWVLFRQRHLVADSAIAPPLSAGSLWPGLWHYAAPLVGLGIWSWLISYADRYLINYYLSPADVGIYSVGYGLGSKLLLLLGPFMSHLSSRLYKLRSGGGDSLAAWRFQRTYLLCYGTLAACTCLLFYFTQNWVGQLLLSEAYRGAFAIGPVIAFGYLLLALINLLEIKWYVFGQTRFIFWHYLAGAILNIGLNLILIPRLHLMGAAVATVLGYGAQLGLVIWLYQYTLTQTSTTNQNT